MKPVVVLMGVCGSGKTEVGRRLAARLGCDFLDGDDFHPPANVEKMRAGTPPGLAIWKAAQVYGVDTRTVAAGMPRKRRKEKAPPPVAGWWQE